MCSRRHEALPVVHRYSRAGLRQCAGPQLPQLASEMPVPMSIVARSLTVRIRALPFLACNPVPTPNTLDVSYPSILRHVSVAAPSTALLQVADRELLRYLSGVGGEVTAQAGSTATVAVIRGDRLVVANVGDSQVGTRWGRGSE